MIMGSWEMISQLPTIPEGSMLQKLNTGQRMGNHYYFFEGADS